MNLLSNMEFFQGAKKKKRRVARGQSSGWGRTAGRGNKGQKSRSGGSTRLGFEGGQTPLYRQLPKLKGFKPLKQKDYIIINLNQIEKVNADIVDLDFLKEKGFCSKNVSRIKILGDGELKRKVTIKANLFSKNAEKAVIKAGGKVEIVNG